MVFDIDGSILEGGGQILRMSVALSVLRQIPIRIQQIRANRSKKGLGAQHLTGIRLARDICEGKLQNDVLGSPEITFIPNNINSGTFVADTRTGGSVALLLQVSLPCAIFGKDQTHLTLKGGTNADKAPQIDYVINVLKPNLQKFGINFEVNLIMRGFFYGHGVVNVTIDPVKKLKPIDLIDFGDVESIEGEAYVTKVLPLTMAAEMAVAAESVLRESVKAKKIYVKAIKFRYKDAFGTSSGINLVAKTTTGCYLGSSNLGAKGVSADETGSKAAEILLEAIKKKCCADQNMQDQLILFMALADGKSRIKVGPITCHTETAIYIAQLLTKAKFSIIKFEDCTNIIECEGIGQQNKTLRH